jgi:GTP-binding protein
MTDFETDEGLGRFEAILAKMGVDRRLQEMGARDGDTVRIAGYEFDYS